MEKKRNKIMKFCTVIFKIDITIMAAKLFVFTIHSCKDKKEKNKNDFFFEFDNKGSSDGDNSNLEQGKEVLENGYVNTGFEKPLPEEQEYTDIEGVTEEVTSSSTAKLTVHAEEQRPKSEEQKAMETFDLIADLDDKSMDNSSIDAKMMIY